MTEKYTYHESEHYEFPKNPVEQADEEMRLYPTPDAFRANLVTLKRLYAKTPIMKSMERYSRIASIVRIPEIDGGGTGSFNFGFFSGALLGVHINVAPAPKSIKRGILVTDLLHADKSDPFLETKLEGIKEFFLEWAGQSDAMKHDSAGGPAEAGWSEFFDEQTPEYQERAMAMADLVYGNQNFTHELQLDFLMGYTFASNMVWNIAGENAAYPPV